MSTNKLQDNLNAILDDKLKKLLPENLREGVTAFGVTGTMQEKIDTSDATATAEDIKRHKTAYINDEKVVGTSVNGQIKQFKDFKEMQDDIEAELGDLAVLYKDDNTFEGLYKCTEYAGDDDIRFIPISNLQLNYKRDPDDTVLKIAWDGNFSKKTYSKSKMLQVIDKMKKDGIYRGELTDDIYVYLDENEDPFVMIVNESSNAKYGKAAYGTVYYEAESEDSEGLIRVTTIIGVMATDSVSEKCSQCKLYKLNQEDITYQETETVKSEGYYLKYDINSLPINIGNFEANTEIKASNIFSCWHVEPTKRICKADGTTEFDPKEFIRQFEYTPAPTQLTLNSTDQLFPDVIGYGETGVITGTATMDADALAQDIAKDKIAYVKGEKVIGNSIKTVKNFISEDEMYKDTTVEEGDIAIIYPPKFRNITLEDRPTILYFPEEVTLPQENRDTINFYFEEVDSHSAWYNSHGQFRYDYFSIQGSDRGPRFDVGYTSDDGIHFKRYMLRYYYEYEEVETDGIVSIGFPLKLSMNDYEGRGMRGLDYFIQVPDGEFNGIYKAVNKTDYTTLVGYNISFDENDEFVYTEFTETRNAEFKNMLTNVLNDVTEGKRRTYAANAIIYKDDNNFDILIAASPWDNLEFKTVDKLLYVNKSRGTSTSTYTLYNYHYNLTTNTFTKDIILQPTSTDTGWMNLNIPVDGSKILFTVFYGRDYWETDIYDFKESEGTQWVTVHEILGFPNKFLVKAEYLPAITQFTLEESNQLLKDVIAFGNGKVVKGTLEPPTAEQILQGKTVMGVEGTATSDADATADSIEKGKTAYIQGEKVTGNFDYEELITLAKKIKGIPNHYRQNKEIYTQLLDRIKTEGTIDYRCALAPTEAMEIDADLWQTLLDANTTKVWNPAISISFQGKEDPITMKEPINWLRVGQNGVEFRLLYGNGMGPWKEWQYVDDWIYKHGGEGMFIDRSNYVGPGWYKRENPEFEDVHFTELTKMTDADIAECAEVFKDFEYWVTSGNYARPSNESLQTPETEEIMIEILSRILGITGKED